MSCEDEKIRRCMIRILENASGVGRRKAGGGKVCIPFCANISSEGFYLLLIDGDGLVESERSSSRFSSSSGV